SIPLGGYVLSGGTLNSELRIYKLIDGQRVEIFKAIPITLTDKATPTYTVGTVGLESLVSVRSQPIGSDRMVMSYRVQNTNDPWTVLPLNKGVADANGGMQFWLSTLQSGIGPNNYEMRYVAMSSHGNVLNSGEGTMQVLSNGVSFTQTARHIGGGGQAFVDAEGYLNITEQALASRQATLSVQAQTGSQSTIIPLLIGTPAMLGDKVTPGWYKFKLAELGLTAGRSYTYVLEAHDADGISVTSLVQGSFTAGNPNSYTAPQVLQKHQRVVLKNLPLNTTHGLIRFTAKTPNAVPQTAQLQLTGPGELTWSALQLSAASAQNYDISYEAYDDQERLVSSGQQTMLLGDKAAQSNAVASNTPGGQKMLPALGLMNPDLTNHSVNKYNAFGEVKEQIDSLDRSTLFSYNTLGKLVKKDAPLTDIVSATGKSTQARPTTSYSYDLQGRLIAVTDANGASTTQQWTAQSASGDSHVAAEYHADGGIKYSRYDVFGNLTQSINENWDGVEANKKYYATTYEYDKNHQVTKVVRPARNNTTYTKLGYDSYVYDSVGNRISHTSLINDTESTTDTTSYDALGRVITTVSGAERTVTTKYEDGVLVKGLNGQMVIGQRVTTTNGNASNNKLVDEKDLFGRVTAHIDLGLHSYQYNYNLAGWLTQQTSSTGQNITYQYYNDGHIKKISDLALMTYSMYEYDSEGNRTKESYATWFDKNVYQQATIKYDELNRIKTITDPQYSLSFEYDAVGNKRHLVSTVTGKPESGQDYWYRYDTMNRFIVTMGTLNGTRGADGTTIIAGAAGGAGVHLLYDKMGQRVQADIVRDGHSEKYAYTTDGFLETSRLTNAGKYVATPVTGSPGGLTPSEADFWTAATRSNDLMGRVGTYKEYIAGGGTVANTHDYYYDKDSKVIDDVLKTPGPNSTLITVTTHYDMLKDGTLNYTQATQSSSNRNIPDTQLYTYYGYEWGESAKQSTITSQPYNSQAPGWKAGTSNFKYDVNGYVAKAIDAGLDGVIDTADDRSLVYTSNGQGLILSRYEIAPSAAPKLQTYYYVNGTRVGETGPDGTGTVDYAQALAISAGDTLPVQIAEIKFPWRRKPIPIYEKPAATPGFSYQHASLRPVNFDQSYQPITPTYPGFTSNGYTVSAGETLESIARSVWGDSSLWYLIAEANGMMSASTPLTKGQTLVIPNKVTNVHNNSGTLKVYD
ncbi:MAG: LysM peptidoglycan-binding domain-containing protein, partial [Rubrivivax sp.]